MMLLLYVVYVRHKSVDMSIILCIVIYCRVLFCEACYDITDLGLKSLTTCEQLNYLNISYCHHVSVIHCACTYEVFTHGW